MSNKTDAAYYSGEDDYEYTMEDVEKNRSRFSGQDSKQNDFPVRNTGRFSGQNLRRTVFPVKINWHDALSMLVFSIFCVFIFGTVFAAVGILVYSMFAASVLWSCVGIAVMIVLFIVCVIITREK